MLVHSSLRRICALPLDGRQVARHGLCGGGAEEVEVAPLGPSCACESVEMAERVPVVCFVGVIVVLLLVEW